jgi:transcriptional regulator with XRE-family HTH domain
MYRYSEGVHPVYMGKKADKIPSRGQKVISRLKPDRPRHFLREWRKHRVMTLEAVAEAVGEITGDGLTHASLSRIERGRQPYSQPQLEALAYIYNTDPGSLLMRNPMDPDAIWSIWDQAKTVEQRTMIRDLAATVVKTGTSF